MVASETCYSLLVKPFVYFLYLTRKNCSFHFVFVRKQRDTSRFSLFQGKFRNIFQGILSVTN